MSSVQGYVDAYNLNGWRGVWDYASGENIYAEDESGAEPAESAPRVAPAAPRPAPIVGRLALMFFGVPVGPAESTSLGVVGCDGTHSVVGGLRCGEFETAPIEVSVPVNMSIEQHGRPRFTFSENYPANEAASLPDLAENPDLRMFIRVGLLDTDRLAPIGIAMRDQGGFPMYQEVAGTEPQGQTYIGFASMRPMEIRLFGEGQPRPVYIYAGVGYVNYRISLVDDYGNERQQDIWLRVDNDGTVMCGEVECRTPGSFSSEEEANEYYRNNDQSNVLPGTTYPDGVRIIDTEALERARAFYYVDQEGYYTNEEGSRINREAGESPVMIEASRDPSHRRWRVVPHPEHYYGTPEAFFRAIQNGRVPGVPDTMTREQFDAISFRLTGEVILRDATDRHPTAEQCSEDVAPAELPQCIAMDPMRDVEDNASATQVEDWLLTGGLYQFEINGDFEGVTLDSEAGREAGMPLFVYSGEERVQVVFQAVCEGEGVPEYHADGGFEVDSGLPPADADADIDTDVDVDGDSDSDAGDADADQDFEVEQDADGTIWPDAGTDGDADVDADDDIDGDADAIVPGDADGDADEDFAADADLDGITVSDAEVDADEETDADAETPVEPGYPGAAGTGVWPRATDLLGVDYSFEDAREICDNALSRYFGLMDTGAVYRDDGTIVTEGQAGAMYLALLDDDETRFQSAWAYTNSHMQSRDFPGLFAWICGSYSCNPVFDPLRDENSAPDADIMMAAALYMASVAWGDGAPPFDYSVQAERIAAALLEHAVTEDNYLTFSPRNLDWFSPSYQWEHFAEALGIFTGNPRWFEVNDNGFNLTFATLRAGNGNLDNGLVPNGCLQDGSEILDPLAPEVLLYQFWYDAMRTGALIALYQITFGDNPRAQEYLNDLMSFFGPMFDSFGDGYELDGTQLSPWHSPSWVGAMTIAALGSSDTEAQVNLTNHLLEILSDGRPLNYYDLLWTNIGCRAVMGEARTWLL